jgi:cellulose synthase/poly-beta-1,6-N-acetylglucosamine synthase-like glycosyltransferase
LQFTGIQEESLLKVSVVIVSRDRCSLFRRALSAALSQNLAREDYEVIAVDDGSSDGTAEMVAALAKKHPNLRYFSQGKKGPASGRNLGIRKAKAGIIAFTDNDAAAEPDWLTSIIRPFRDKSVLGTEGKIIPPKEKRLFHAAPECLHGNRFMTCNMAFRKNALEKAGLFDEGMVFWREDADLSFRVLRQGRIVFVPEAVVRHPLRRVPYLSLLKNLKLLKNDVILFRRFPAEFTRYYGAPFRKEALLSAVSWAALLAILHSLLTLNAPAVLLFSSFALVWKSAEAHGKAFSFRDLAAFLPLSFLRDILFPLCLAYYFFTSHKGRQE